MLGERLKKLRIEKKLTQEELGSLINVTKVSISGYENGNRNPDTETLQKIADVFNVTTDFLLGREHQTYFIDSENAKMIQLIINEKNIDYTALRELLGMTKTEFQDFKWGNVHINESQLQVLEENLGISRSELIKTQKINVVGHEITLTIDELKIFEELKKHPILFHDLASDPAAKVKELTKLYRVKKMLEDEEEEQKEGFGELED